MSTFHETVLSRLFFKIGLFRLLGERQYEKHDEEMICSDLTFGNIKTIPQLNTIINLSPQQYNLMNIKSCSKYEKFQILKYKFNRLLNLTQNHWEWILKNQSKFWIMHHHKKYTSKELHNMEIVGEIIRPTHNVDIVTRVSQTCELIEYVNKNFFEVYMIQNISRDMLNKPLDDRLCIRAFGKKLTIKQFLNELGLEMKAGDRLRQRNSTKCKLPTRRDLQNTKLLNEFIKKYNCPKNNKSVGEKRKWANDKLKELRSLHKQNKKSQCKDVGNFTLNRANIFDSLFSEKSNTNQFQ